MGGTPRLTVFMIRKLSAFGILLWTGDDMVVVRESLWPQRGAGELGQSVRRSIAMSSRSKQSA